MTQFNEAILHATDQLMAADTSVYLMGLGVPDPKGIFGTTIGLQEKYGPERVMDMPCSENAMTGVAIGSAVVGMRPILTHQRVDFTLLALDQIVNNAAKWNYMFGDQMNVPLVIRLVIGRGWGQGPQHSQTLHSLFAHVPGLKVVAPSSPYDAKGLLISAVEENCPVIYLEHRWLHNIHGDVPREMYRVPLGKAKIVQEGSDVTIIASSHMTLEAYKAAQLLKEDGISVEVVDLRSLKPLDTETLVASAWKTGRVIIADADWKTCGLAAEISSLLTERAFGALKVPPKRITYPDSHSPTSWALANHYYPTSTDIAIAALELMEQPTRARALLEQLIESKMGRPHDVPDRTFTGPF
ncbi:MAG: Acetoin:2,6-dichlorophenolindophenol oxidoreductase subunit beta [Chlamydiales bacterium]|nr:Acetoin:2,6-dichlorophenolindophenol oxidoreductase subunit beta [Chlamydiales bacterium]